MSWRAFRPAARAVASPAAWASSESTANLDVGLVASSSVMESDCQLSVEPGCDCHIAMLIQGEGISAQEFDRRGRSPDRARRPRSTRPPLGGPGGPPTWLARPPPALRRHSIETRPREIASLPPPAGPGNVAGTRHRHRQVWLHRSRRRSCLHRRSLARPARLSRDRLDADLWMTGASARPDPCPRQRRGAIGGPCYVNARGPDDRGHRLSSAV